MNRIRWSNIPVPEGHVAFLLLGIGLQRWRPRRLFRAARPRRLLAGPLLLSGILLAGWAVATVEDQDIQNPSELTTSGPYAFTRNPMYLAWHLLYGAVILLVNSTWLLALLPGLLFFTHYTAILPEERRLDRQFGEIYRRYQEGVRRYL